MSYASSIPDAYRTMGNYTCAGFQRHKTYAFASSATHQTGACDQPQHGESARPHNPTRGARNRRRGDRIRAALLRCIRSLMALSGNNEARIHLSLHKDAPIPRAVQTVGTLGASSGRTASSIFQGVSFPTGTALLATATSGRDVSTACMRFSMPRKSHFIGLPIYSPQSASAPLRHR